MATATKSDSKEIAKEANKAIIDDGQLKNVKTFADAIALLNKNGVPSDTIANYGTGFNVVKENDQLIGKPLVILEWVFRKGTFGEYVSAIIVTEDGTKAILNDGSTGICKQLREVTDSRIEEGRAFPQQGLACENGLRRSDYEYRSVDEKTGEETLIPASTYYLS